MHRERFWVSHRLQEKNVISREMRETLQIHYLLDSTPNRALG